MEVTSKGSSSLVKSRLLISAMLSTPLVEVAADGGAAEGAALGEEDEAEQAEDGGGAGDAGEVGGAAAGGAFFFAGVEQHDDEDEEHHDGAGVDDDLGGGEELCAERPVEDRERHHDDDERERGVDGVALEEEVERSCDGQHAKDDEECELHEVWSESFVAERATIRASKAGEKRVLCVFDCKAAGSVRLCRAGRGRARWR